MPYGPEAEAQALHALRARFQPLGFIGLQAGFRLVEPKSLQLGERGGPKDQVLVQNKMNLLAGKH
jgi:hypothetical protein